MPVTSGTLTAIAGDLFLDFFGRGRPLPKYARPDLVLLGEFDAIGLATNGLFDELFAFVMNGLLGGCSFRCIYWVFGWRFQESGQYGIKWGLILAEKLEKKIIDRKTTVLKNSGKFFQGFRGTR